MKRITKCLQCSTAFRVHESQLTARQGKVRCGACGHIFDAFESLLESMPDERPSAPPPAAQAAVTNAPPAAPPAMADTSSAHLSIGAATVWPTTANTGHPKPSAPTKPVQPVATPSAQVKSAVPIAPISVAPQASAVDEPAEEAFDFGAEPANQRSGRGWKIGVAVMTLVIMLQATYWLRGVIAATFPATQAAVYGFCNAVGCSVPLPRQSDKLTLESSDLQFEQSELLSLTATVRNRGSIGQAYPSLLLTLTDQRNRPIARRAIHPQQYLGVQPSGIEVIAAGSTLTAQVQIDGRSLGAAGYEVLVFYP